MAIKNYLKQAKKKLTDYFGVGQPGLGQFGSTLKSSQIGQEISRIPQNFRNVGQDIRRPINNYFAPTPQVRTRDIIREIPQANIQATKKMIDYGKLLYQEPARAAVSLMQKPILGQDTFKPETKFEKFFLRNEPVRSAETSTGAEYLKGRGVNPRIASLAGQGLVLGSLAMDVTGAGSINKKLAKEATEQGVRKILGKNASKYGDDVIKRIAKTKSEKEIGGLLKGKIPLKKPKPEGVVNDLGKQGKILAKTEQGQPKIPKSNLADEGISPQANPLTNPKPQTVGEGLLNNQNLNRSFDANIPLRKQQINISRLKISDKAKQGLDKTISQIEPELKNIKGPTLSNEEVIDSAKASKVLQREMSRDTTKKATAAITRLRQEVAAGAEGKGVTKDFIENLKILKSYSADAGRKLQSFNIQAGPDAGVKEYIISQLIKLGKTSDDIIKAAQGVNFDSPKEAEAFYRKFVKPTFGEVMNEYRYINLLSSPQTHIVNTASNILQGTFVNPATKLYSGVIDNVASKLTGKARQHYIREVPAYGKGVINSIGDAISQAADVLRGNKYVERPDINRISTGKFGPLSGITKALEASDIFFRRLIKGGELEALAYKASRNGKKVSSAILDKQAEDTAAYFVFRKALDPSNATGQGQVLSSIDKVTSAVYKLREVPGFKWFVPFVQTPMNILKQGIEYSPLGLSTTIGATNKTEQVAKALLGSTVMAGAGMIAFNGDSTWAAPTGKKDKEEFYATGRKPYSLKIGDKWVSYSKLGPLAYPIAMASAIKYYFDQDPKSDSTDVIDKTVKMLSGTAGFFADQSYLTGIGNILDIARGDEYAIKRSIADIGRQYVPLSSLQGWIARMVDPIFRKPEGISEQIKVGIPGLSKSVRPYTDPFGDPSVRQNNLFNSFSPIQINPSNPTFENIYQKSQQEKRANAQADALTKNIETGNSLPDGMQQLANGKIAVVINDKVEKFDSPEKVQLAIAKEDLKASDKSFLDLGDIVLKKSSNGNITTQSKIEYTDDLLYQQMMGAKKKGDINTWLDLADKKLAGMQEMLKDPTLDDIEKTTIQNRIDTLLEDAAKYLDYGGFTKPKSTRTSSSRRSGGSRKLSKLSVPKSVIKLPSAPSIKANVKIKKPTSGKSGKIALKKSSRITKAKLKSIA